jgi:DNA-binding NtrC family response regulator
LKAILKHTNDVLTAYNGYDGLKALEENEYNIDIVISDLMMPDISGIGVISIIKKKYPGLAVIAITGWFDDLVTIENRVYVDKFLKKPFDIGDLQQAMAGLLADSNPLQPKQTDLH